MDIRYWKSNRIKISALLITLLAFALRFPLAELRSLTIDEASSLKYVAGKSLLELAVQYHTNSHQLISLLITLLDGVGHRLMIYRAPSLVFAILTVPLLYQLGKKLLGWQSGLLAALLLAIAPLHTDFSVQMRGYAVATFWATVSYYCIWQGIQTAKKRYWLCLAIASVIGIYAHLFTALAVGAGWLIIIGTYLAQIITFYIKSTNYPQLAQITQIFNFSSADNSFYSDEGNNLGHIKRGWPVWGKLAMLSLALTVAGLALTYGPIISRIINTPEIESDWPSQIEALFVAGAFNADAVADYLKVFRLYGPIGEPRSVLVWLFVWLAGFGLLAALFNLNRRQPSTARAGWYCLVWIFAPIVVVIFGLQFINGFYAYWRFFMFFQPLYLLLLAYGIISAGQLLGRWTDSSLAQTGLTTGLILLAVVSAGWKLNEQINEDADNQWYRVAQTILAQDSAPTVICEAHAQKMGQQARHKDECYRNLEFYLQSDLGQPVLTLHREIDQLASIPGVSNIPYLESETGRVWLVLWQSDDIAIPAKLPLGERIGSSLVLVSPEPAIKLLALDKIVDALLQIETTPEDQFSYYLSQAQMKAIIGHREEARSAWLAAEALSPPGIEAENRLKAVAELIGLEGD